jgi:hypothetical protein
VAERTKVVTPRDWDVVAMSKTEAWTAWKKQHGAAGAIRIADELRRQVAAQRPGWPRETDRLDDIICHVRVAEALSRVPPRRR